MDWKTCGMKCDTLLCSLQHANRICTEQKPICLAWLCVCRQYVLFVCSWKQDDLLLWTWCTSCISSRQNNVSV